MVQNRAEESQKREVLKGEDAVPKSPGYSWDRWDSLVPSGCCTCPATERTMQAEKGKREGKDTAPPFPPPWPQGRCPW